MNYINAHATSTLVGDKAEVKAIKKVFTSHSHLKMNATKSMIGHCLGAGARAPRPWCACQCGCALAMPRVGLLLLAAGGMEAIATIQAIRTGWVHPTINHVRRECAACPAG